MTRRQSCGRTCLKSCKNVAKIRISSNGFLLTIVSPFRPISSNMVSPPLIYSTISSITTHNHYPTLSLTNSSLLFIANDRICNATDMKGYDEDDEDRPLILSYKRGKPAWGTPANQLIRYFYSAHQAFFKTLCMSLKLEAVVRIAEEALADGKVPQIPNTHIK